MQPFFLGISVADSLARLYTPAGWHRFRAYSYLLPGTCSPRHDWGTVQGHGTGCLPSRLTAAQSCVSFTRQLQALRRAGSPRAKVNQAGQRDSFQETWATGEPAFGLGLQRCTSVPSSVRRQPAAGPPEHSCSRQLAARSWAAPQDGCSPSSLPALQCLPNTLSFPAGPNPRRVRQGRARRRVSARKKAKSICRGTAWGPVPKRLSGPSWAQATGTQPGSAAREAPGRLSSSAHAALQIKEQDGSGRLHPRRKIIEFRTDCSSSCQHPSPGPRLPGRDLAGG